MRTLVQIVAGAAALALPFMAHANPPQAQSGIVQLAQAGDSRVQGIQPVSPPAPGTRAIGPTVRPFGASGNEESRGSSTTPSLPPEAPPPGYYNYPDVPPSQGLMTIPRGG
jgi:hypothetical protein